MQVLARDGAGRDAHHRLARRCAATAAVIAQTVFLLIRVIGVSGPKAITDLLVVVGALVGVLDDEADRRSGRAALENAGQDPHPVRLAPLARITGRSGAASVDVALDIVLGELKIGRTTIDDAAERGPVALAEARDGEQPAGRVTRHAYTARAKSARCASSCARVRLNTPPPPCLNSSHANGTRGYVTTSRWSLSPTSTNRTPSDAR